MLFLYHHILWRILRICYELAEFKLIDRVQINESGINVQYKFSTIGDNNEKLVVSKSTLIRTEADVDALRRIINDVAVDVPAFQFYDGMYFQKNSKDRKLHRDGFEIVNDDQQPVEVTNT
jgi:hypothetical protein